MLQVRHVHTQDQLADLMTKQLSKERTIDLRYKIGLTNESSILREHNKESVSTVNITGNASSISTGSLKICINP